MRLSTESVHNTIIFIIMRVPISMSLILSSVKAFFIQSTPVKTGIPRCDSKERLNEIPVFDLDKPVPWKLELILEVAPLAVIGGLVAISGEGHNL